MAGETPRDAGAAGRSSGGLRVCGIGGTDAEGSKLARAWASSGGLLLIRAGALSPQALVEAASWFGDVDDCHATHVHPRLVLPSCSAIMTVTNRRDQATGEPLLPPGPVCEGGEHQVQFPARRGWHTDCSFRWPPPDATLLYCEQPAAADTCTDRRRRNSLRSAAGARAAPAASAARGALWLRAGAN